MINGTKFALGKPQKGTLPMNPPKSHRRLRAWLAMLSLSLLLTAWPHSSASAAGSNEADANVQTASAVGGATVGYYAGWASYQGYQPKDIPAEDLTQINYAFAAIDGDTGKLVLDNPTQDKKNLSGLLALKKRNPALRVLISVGGWDYSAYFSDVASTAQRRATFAQSCVDLITAHGLDGIDLDWEYPVSGGQPGVIHRPQDKQNFTLLLQAIRDALDKQSKRDGKTYSLTIAGAVGGGYLSCIEPKAVANIVDHIFLMTYDIHGPWSSYADFNAPLYTPSGSSPQSRYSVSDGVKAWLAAGVPAGKLVLGMPLYGYIYQGVKSTNYGLYSTFTSAKSITYNQLKASYLSNSTYRQLRHSTAQVPYLYGKNTFISYDDPKSIAAKASLAVSQGLGGIGFWELSQDKEAELISAACEVWNQQGFRDVPATAWYAQAVERVSQQGWMYGTTATTFSPYGTLTRGMLAAILYRMEGQPAVSGTASAFSDVDAKAYYASAVAWAAKAGIVQGYGDGTFRPNGLLTRQQLCAMLFRYASWRNEDGGGRSDLSAFTDAASVSPYAREAMAWAIDAGVIQGRTATTLAPYGTATRAQTAVMLVRLEDEFKS